MKLFFPLLISFVTCVQTIISAEKTGNLAYIKRLYPNAATKTYNTFFETGKKEKFLQGMKKGDWISFIPESGTASVKVNDTVLCIAFEIYSAKADKKKLKKLITSDQFKKLDSAKIILQLVSMSADSFKFLSKAESFPIEYNYRMCSDTVCSFLKLTSLEIIDSAEGALMLKYAKDGDRNYQQALIVDDKGRITEGKPWQYGNLGGFSRCEILVEFSNIRYENRSVMATMQSLCDESCLRKCKEYHIKPGRNVEQTALVKLNKAEEKEEPVTGSAAR
jgi:hypothetical protein